MAMKTETSSWETCLAPAAASLAQLGMSALGTSESGNRTRRREGENKDGQRVRGRETENQNGEEQRKVREKNCITVDCLSR